MTEEPARTIQDFMTYAEEQAKSPKRRETFQGDKLSYCDRCGRLDGNNRIFPLHSRKCECDRKMSSASSAVREADPFSAMTFDTLTLCNPSVEDAAKKLKTIAVGEREGGVFMLGLPGRGKTHLSVATVRAALEAGRLAGFFNLAELVTRIQSTYGYSDAAETKAQIIESVREHDLVVIDDFGKEHRSPDVESIVYQLIDGLYRARKTLVASSNLPGKDFVERYDGAVLSRLGGMCEKVVIRGEDRRAKAWDWS